VLGTLSIREGYFCLVTRGLSALPEPEHEAHEDEKDDRA
jgi:hypothetical protein